MGSDEKRIDVEARAMDALSLLGGAGFERRVGRKKRRPHDSRKSIGTGDGASSVSSSMRDSHGLTIDQRRPRRKAP